MHKYDVAIIGGGPAGSAMAAYIQKAGFSSIVIEKEQFPRPHVGEALVVACNRVFNEIGVTQKLISGDFIYKYGASWTAQGASKVFSHEWNDFNKDQDLSVDFSKSDGTFYTTTSLHVDRAKFDKILLDHAKELGAKVVESTSVYSFNNSSAGCSVFCRNEQGEEVEIKSKVIVDASGRRTLCGNSKGWKVKDKVFDQCAIHTWFKGVEINEKERHYTYIHFLPEANSWLWQIPITDDIVSYGVVSQKSSFQKNKQGLADYFWEMVGKREDLANKLRKGTLVNDFKIEGDYSYAMQQIADDGLILIGDAARFVDPIFSSGVSVALNSARLASDDVVKALKEGRFDKEQFNTFEDVMEKGTNNWYKFIGLYYRLNVMFTYFIAKKEYRKDVIKFLQGDVYDDSGDELLQAMEKMIKDVEENPQHPLHAYLGELSSKSFRVDYTGN